MRVLGDATGRRETPEALKRLFAHALCTRITKRSGCVTFHHYHCYVAEGLPQPPVGLWGEGQDLRAVFDPVGVATYPCRYDPRQGCVHALQQGSVAPTRFVSSQGALRARTPHDSRVCYRPPSSKRRSPEAGPAQQGGLFVWRQEESEAAG